MTLILYRKVTSRNVPIVLAEPLLVLVTLSCKGFVEFFRYFCIMKRFRTVTIFTLAAVAMMVVANVVYLYTLYNSIKEQSVQTAAECLRRADMMEIISRMEQADTTGDYSFFRLTLTIQGEKSADGRYEYPAMVEKMDQTMSGYFHVMESVIPGIPARDYRQLARIFRQELTNAGMTAEEVRVSGVEAVPEGCGRLWQVSVNGTHDTPVIYGYISPLTGYVFNRMAGIIVTSAAILVLMSFLVWYLLRWVGKLRTIEQMKDDFTHNMTHELKTPVAVAYSAADSMLRYYDQSDEQRNKKYLAIIMQRLNLLSGMIENILSVSLERFKTMRLDIGSVAMEPLVREVAGMIEMKAGKPVSITVDIREGATVRTDSLHFGNMISNLLDNAVKYSGDAVDIRIEGDSQKISISDNGIGISAADLPRIFDKFYRVTDGDRYEVGGYGLGLYYVRQIADMQGWSISVTSRENVGTTFTIKFSSDEKR